jgi:hypothetical protein
VSQNKLFQSPLNEPHKLSAEDFWLALQRFLIFEEPSSRWPKIRKGLLKVASKRLSAAVLGKLTPLEQDYLFADIYGASDEKSTSVNRAINILFALKDFQKFQKITFDMWAVGLKDFYSHSDRPNFVKLVNLAKGIASANNLAPSQELWLLHSCIAVPGWTALTANGPWSQDERAQFVQKLIGHLGGELTAANVSALLHQFNLEEKKARSNLPGGFLPERILLVEGPTEQIVIPHLARCLNLDLDARRIMLVPSGGANQVLRRYLNFRELVSIPINCLLDGDVAQYAEAISEHLRDQDELFSLDSGEIEDVFSREQLTQIANSYIQLHKESSVDAPVLIDEIGEESSNKEVLERLWRRRNWGSFDKIGFAQATTKSITDASEVPGELRQIIEKIAKDG